MSTQIEHDDSSGDPIEDWAKQFKPDAKIWELYLIDAEEEAKETAEVWKDGLDSLLIFAGLFAGVVSSFVTTVDSTEDTSTSDVWIKGLWASSLLVTIFSAVMGVLAKAWSVKFIPVSSKREAKDAYQRRILDKRAKRWQLERVIKFIPLLIQIAAFLFTAGFIVQSYVVNQRIGKLTVTLACVGLGVYVIASITPVLYPSSPFGTPLSDLIRILKDLISACLRQGSRRKTINFDIWSEKRIEDELADIWLNELIKSTKVTHVDEAIAELTRHWPNLHTHWRKYFGNSDTPSMVVRRLEEYITLGFHNKSDEHEELCYHIVSLLHFTHHYESLTQKDKSSPLCRALSDTLTPSGPLHRWNIFPELVRPLAFIPRTHLMIFAARGDLDNPHTSYTDFSLDEVDDRPWEIMTHSVRPQHRLNYVIAACRGLIQGAKNLQTVSSFILAMSIAKAAAIGLTVEWNGDVPIAQKTKAEDMAKKYVVKLLGTIATKWEGILVNEKPDKQILLTLKELKVDHPSMEVAATGYIMSLLSHPEISTRMDAINVFKAFTHKSILNDAALNYLIPMLAPVVLRDEDNGVRKGALDLYLTLQRKYTTEVHEMMIRCTVAAIQEGLHGSDKIRLRTLKALVNMQVEFRKETTSFKLFEIFMANYVVEVTKMAIDKSQNGSKVNDAARILLAGLLEHYHVEIKYTIREHLKSMFGSPWIIMYWRNWSGPLNITLELLGKCELIRQDVEFWMNVFIIDRIFDITWASEMASLAERRMAGFFGAKFIQTENDSINEEYNDCIEKIRDMLQLDPEKWNSVITMIHEGRVKEELKSVSRKNRLTAVRFCQTVALIPELIRFGVEDDDPDVRSESLKLINFMISGESDYDVLAVLKANIIMHMHEMFEYESSSPAFQLEWIKVVGLLAERTEFPEGVSKLIEIAVKSSDYSHREQARSSLLRISTKMPRTISKEMIVQLNKSANLEALINGFCNMPEPEEGLYWLELLVLLKDHDVTKEILRMLSPAIVKCKEETLFQRFCDEMSANPYQTEIRAKLWVQALGYLAECSDHLPEITSLLLRITRKSDNEMVRTSAMKALASLILKERCSALLRGMIEESPDLLHQRGEEAHCAWISSFAFLALRGDTEFFLGQIREFITGKKVYTERTYAAVLEKLSFLASVKNNDKLLEAVESLVSIIDLPPELPRTARLEWLKLCTQLAQIKIHKWTQEVINFSTQDENTSVRCEAIQCLISLVTNGDIFQDAIIAMIPKINNIHEIDSEWELRMEWVDLFTALSKNGSHNTLVTIVKISNEDEDEDVRPKAANSLISLLKTDVENGHENVIKIISSKHLETGLEDGSWEVCRAWVKLSEYLPQSNQELNVISKLADTFISNDTEDVQNSAINMILKLLTRDNKMTPSVTSNISQMLEARLKDQEHRYRSRAIIAVNIIVGISENFAQFKEDVISRIAPHLLTIAIGEDSELQSEAQKTLEQIKKMASDKPLRSIFSAISSESTLGNITREGKVFVVSFFRTLILKDMNSLTSAARNFAAISKNGLQHARGIATKLLSCIYSQYVENTLTQAIENTVSDRVQLDDPFAQTIEDTISDVIYIALDEKRDDEDRTSALKMIVQVSKNTEARHFYKIKRSLSQFIALLEDEQLKVPTVELVSLLAVDENVRKTILSQAISMTTSKETQSFKGYISLFTRLLLDNRLKSEPTDYAMILLACSVVSHPRLAHLRFQATSALYCYYSKDEEELKNKIPDDLVKWFVVALFGNHATRAEVNTWCEMSVKWLPDNPVAPCSTGTPSEEQPRYTTTSPQVAVTVSFEGRNEKAAGCATRNSDMPGQNIPYLQQRQWWKSWLSRSFPASEKLLIDKEAPPV